MVDLNRRRGRPAAAERNRLAGVGIGELAGHHRAAVGAGLKHDRGQVASEDVVAGVAAVVTAGDVDVVGPGFAELGAGVAGHGGPTLHGQGRQRGGGRLGARPD